MKRMFPALQQAALEQAVLQQDVARAVAGPARGRLRQRAGFRAQGPRAQRSGGRGRAARGAGRHLAGPARRDNADAISRLLATLDDATLAKEAAATPAEEPLYNFLGRALIARGLPLPHPFARGDWRFDAGDRPPADRDGYRPPQHLAVLLR